VDNCVDKRLLTSRKRRIDAGFNKMPVQQAEFEPVKNQGLAWAWRHDQIYLEGKFLQDYPMGDNLLRLVLY
jgi:hypothetical protein